MIITSRWCSECDDTEFAPSIFAPCNSTLHKNTNVIHAVGVFQFSQIIVPFVRVNVVCNVDNLFKT